MRKPLLWLAHFFLPSSLGVFFLSFFAAGLGVRRFLRRLGIQNEFEGVMPRMVRMLGAQALAPNIHSPLKLILNARAT